MLVLFLVTKMLIFEVPVFSQYICRLPNMFKEKFLLLRRVKLSRLMYCSSW